MRILEVAIPTSLGEIIYIKHYLDSVKDQFSQIKINYGTGLWDSCLHTERPDWADRKKLWDKHLVDISNLFFSEPPYIVDRQGNFQFTDSEGVANGLGIVPQKADLGHLLCKGTSLNLGEEYIVLTTKIRYLHKKDFNAISSQLWATLTELSKKYKIVVLGERVVEMRREYELPQLKDVIFGIYDDIIANIPKERLLDLTVPALGETVSDLSQVQQDCLIMKEAKFVVTFGVGGNFAMSTATANMTIGFRGDNLKLTDIMFDGKRYPGAFITKDSEQFIKLLRSYL
jgi:hypothetical protein